MFSKLMPREGRFFDLFNAHAAQIAEGGRALAQLFADFEAVAAHAARIDAAEHSADKITHEDTAESIVLYDIRRVSPEALQLAKICQMTCDRVRAAVGLLANLGDPEAILKTCEEIDRLESDADRVMRSAMSRLFREESDVKQLIKLRTIYELLELITDRCEDVANIVEGIVLEHS
jgi:uncharacterized protein Yka (UPF0111/DUF47 family)